MDKTDEIRLLVLSAETISAEGIEKYAGQYLVRIECPECFDETLRPQQFHAGGFTIEPLSAEIPFTMQTDRHVEIEMMAKGGCDVRLK